MANILIVEDDQKLGSIMKEVLEEASYDVTWVESAEAVGPALQGQPADPSNPASPVQPSNFDLIYLDIMLAGEKDGYAVLRELKILPSTKHIPVVMMTNLGQTSEIERAMEAGAKDYLIKANIKDIDVLPELTLKFLQS